MNAYEQLLADRTTTCAGLFLGITRQCPLACAHCSTRSRPDLPPARHHDSLVEFIRGISRHGGQTPRHVLFTGGEPFLHPQLLVVLSDHAHRWGALVHAITGGFFAHASKLPIAIRDAIKTLDSISLSWDRYHEAFVSYGDFVRMVETVCDLGPVVSLQLTVDNADLSLPRRLRERFPALEIFVTSLGSNGRARDENMRTSGLATADSPCTVAAWPVVSYTGAILACCNQDSVDEPPDRVPHHLLLGELATTSWAQVVDRRLASKTLRCIETVGPAAASDPANTSLDRCSACRALDADSHVFADRTPGPQLVSAVMLLRQQWFQERRTRA